MNIPLKGKRVYGFGERFDALNQAGLIRDNRVYETFTNQGADTYMPVPFCVTDGGMGVFVDTYEPFPLSAQDSEGGLVLSLPDQYKARIFKGSPAEILDEFTKLTGRPKLPPDWAFGLWISANRWNTQEIIEEQTALSVHYGMKPSVVVLEAWSDEATFYLFDEKRFPDPQGMIDGLHKQNIRLLLWQVPVLKRLEEGRVCPQHEADCAEALENGYVVRKADGSPYTIPGGRWFGGSMIPDFTNPRAAAWWFGKRKYLLDMGIDGFKTDGGEFVYDDDACFFDGRTGREMRNAYAAAYTKAYAGFTGDGRVLFSRAGYTGSQTTPLHWAGDQKSTWAELRHVLTAGLNAGLSGIPFWGFDIAGFAGPLPPADLYLRGFALACFSPVTQWHSEPPGGQFADILAPEDGINDRSPWNIAKRARMPEVISICRELIEERTRLMPYILREARISAQTGRPLMSALVVDWPDDETAAAVDDEFMFGRDLLVAPVLEEGKTGREVYLPKGRWTDHWTGEQYSGPGRIFRECGPGKILVWNKEGRQDR
ncbi:MAG: glycoside hydrolase [Treponema sp.]|jgi:alpha-D-xyloside xylohydrolase|nr:glycoside hydrolase [Treponema sp.]